MIDWSVFHQETFPASRAVCDAMSSKCGEIHAQSPSLDPAPGHVRPLAFKIAAGNIVVRCMDVVFNYHVTVRAATPSFEV